MGLEVYLRDLVGVLSLVIAVVALTLNNIYASRRDKRKEFRGRLESILGKISELESISVQFHTRDNFDELVADEIAWKADRLSKEIQSVSAFRNNTVSQSFNLFKKSLTSNNFGASKFSKRARNSECIRDIHAMSSRLSSTLMKIYDKSHPLN